MDWGVDCRFLEMVSTLLVRGREGQESCSLERADLSMRVALLATLPGDERSLPEDEP